MDIHKFLEEAPKVLLVLFAIFWIYHIIECLRRKDFKIFDKIFWTILLLVPVIGLIMYRGIGNEFYKKGTMEMEKPAAQASPADKALKNTPKKRIPRGGVKIQLPMNNTGNPESKK
jgi:hypothetical protein